MKLLLDQGVPRSVVHFLAASGADAIHVGELGLATATDDQIITYARQHQYAIVTLDADFHALLALSRATSPSVIRIRIEGLKGEQVAAILAQVIATSQAELDSGSVVSVTSQRIRVRLLPIV